MRVDADLSFIYHGEHGEKLDMIDMMNKIYDFKNCCFPIILSILSILSKSFVASVFRKIQTREDPHDPPNPRSIALI